MSEVIRKKPSGKFLWSHQGVIHRLVVRIANHILRVIPFRFKYAIGINLKKNIPPYSLVEGKVIVQVGAPYDTLNAGRSRGMYFCKLVGPDGKALIVEPLHDSVLEFKKRASELRLQNVVVHESGAWSEQSESYINVDVAHPATNFTGDTVDYSEERVSQFEKVKIKLDTLDNICEVHDLKDVFLVSITTNWAEEEILKGMSKLLSSGVSYVCLAYGKDNETYESLMSEMGFDIYSHDDRGVTYVRR